MEEFYSLLGLTSGVYGAKELRRAYRRKALECHPDKRPNDTRAAARFGRLQHALKVLLKECERKSYVECHTHVDERRKQMVDELQRQEAAYEAQRKTKVAEDNTSKRLKEEIEEIRAKRARYCEHTASTNTAHYSRRMLCKEDLDKTLLVTWDATCVPRYDEESLQRMFTTVGLVEGIQMLDSRRGYKGSALVVMKSASAVNAATHVLFGHVSNPLLALPMRLITSKHALDGLEFYCRESRVLRKLKNSQERKKTLKQKEQGVD